MVKFITILINIIKNENELLAEYNANYSIFKWIYIYLNLKTFLLFRVNYKWESIFEAIKLILMIKNFLNF